MGISRRSTKWVILFFLFFSSMLCFATENSSGIFNSSSANTKIKLEALLNNSDSRSVISLTSETVLDTGKVRDRSSLLDAYLTNANLLVKAGKYEDALLSANQALMVALETGKETKVSQAYELVSKIYLSKGFKSESLEYLYKGLEVNKHLKDSAQITWYLVSIPMVEYELGRLANAMEISLKSVEIFEKKGDSINLAKGYNLLGLIHIELGNYSTSQSFLEKSLNLFSTQKDSLNIGITYNSIARLCFATGKFDDSEMYISKASEILKKHDSKTYYRNQSLLGSIYTKRGKYANALLLLSEAVEDQKKIGDFYGQANTFLELGNLFSKKSDYRNAIGTYKKCINLSKENGLLKLNASAYKGLANALGKSGNIKEAYKYMNLYVDISDSLQNLQKANEAYKLASQVEIKQKENEIMLQSEELTRNLDRIKQAKQNQLLLYVILFLSISLMIFAYREYKLKKKANIDLSIQKKEIEEQSILVQKRNRDITDSLNYARRIQQAILRTSLRLEDFFPESFILFIPKDIVSGDFYWVKSKDESILFAIADCTGHGAPGAFMSIIGTYGLNRLVTELDQVNPGDILNDMNELFQNSISQREGSEIFDGMDIALCSYNRSTRELVYAGANLPLHILRENSKPQATSQIVHNNNTHTLYQVKPDKQPIGYVFEQTTYKTHSIKLIEGDIIYLFSDGFADQFGGLYKKKFRYQELRKLICDIATKPLVDQRLSLEQSFRTWKGDNIQVDDVSFMGIKVS